MHINLLSSNMTASKKPKKEVELYVSSRAWAEDCLQTVKKMQDEYLDRYHEDKEGNTNMLTLLQKLVEQLEKKL
jgi:DNA polymerase III delta prime subunit